MHITHVQYTNKRVSLHELGTNSVALSL